MADLTAYEASVPTAGDVAAPYEYLLDLFDTTATDPADAWVNCADIDALNPVATARIRSRSSYAFKGTPAEDKKGDNWVVTFNAEKVRVPETGAIAQPWLIDLLAAADGVGEDNRVRIRWYDAINGGEAHDGIFRVERTRTNTTGDDSAAEWYTFTLTSYGAVSNIAPVDVDGVA